MYAKISDRTDVREGGIIPITRPDTQTGETRLTV